MTNMSEALDYLLAFVAGFGLGLAFFGGLWWTVSRLSRGNGAAWLFPLSSLVRTALLLVGFWWVAAAISCGSRCACQLVDRAPVHDPPLRSARRNCRERRSRMHLSPDEVIYWQHGFSNSTPRS